MSRLTFAILGAGAMGSILGAHLARAGHCVTLLARGRRAAQLRNEGLRITGLNPFSIPVKVLEDPTQLRQADVFIVTTKAIGTAAALEPFANARIGRAFSVQNGVMKNSLLADAFGQKHVLGALANMSGELLPSGEVLFTRNVNILIGDPAQPAVIPADILDLTRTIDGAGVRSTAVADILSQEWSKFAAWAGWVAVSLATRSVSWRHLMDPGAALVLVRMVREVNQLAAHLGISLTDESMFPVASLSTSSEAHAIRTLVDIGRQFRDNAPKHRLSILQDAEAGRPLEVEETLGFAVQSARQAGLTLTLLEAFYHLAAAIDRMARNPA